MSRYIETLNCDSEYILWVKLDKSYAKSEQHIIFGVVYVPPTQSRFLNEDEFEIFQNEITDMCSKYDYIYLAGDFNAQIANLSDYTTADDFLGKHFDLDEELSPFYNQKSALEQLGIQVHRNSMDKKKNNNGFKLLEICKNDNLFILNGRFGTDKNTGSYTFRESSVIDYVISSVQSLELLVNFEITALDRLYSDGHALLSFEIKGNTQIEQLNTHKQNSTCYPIWDATKAHTFQNNISLQKLQDVADQMSQEPYFLKLQPKHYIPLVKFRTGNHRFPVEIYRWEGIPLSERKYTLCNSNDIGDEYHYLLKCNFFADSRRQYIHKYYYTRSNMLKYKELLSLTSPAKLIKLSSFIRILLTHFSRRTS